MFFLAFAFLRFILFLNNYSHGHVVVLQTVFFVEFALHFDILGCQRDQRAARSALAYADDDQPTLGLQRSRNTLTDAILSRLDRVTVCELAGHKRLQVDDLSDEGHFLRFRRLVFSPPARRVDAPTIRPATAKVNAGKGLRWVLVMFSLGIQSAATVGRPSRRHQFTPRYRPRLVVRITRERP